MLYCQRDCCRHNSKSCNNGMMYYSDQEPPSFFLKYIKVFSSSENVDGEVGKYVHFHVEKSLDGDISPPQSTDLLLCFRLCCSSMSTHNVGQNWQALTILSTCSSHILILNLSNINNLIPPRCCEL